MKDKNKYPKPFLKWVGGKTKLLDKISERIPPTINTYYEPFLGGGAVFFSLARRYGPINSVLSDMNSELTNTYGVLKSDAQSVVDELKSGGYEYDRDVFLKIRSLKPSSLDPVRRAARFIYLNRTCFNGLYRVNRKGEFNTPFGKYENPTICDTENLLSVGDSLKKSKIVNSDFAKVVAEVRAGDVVYFDPPYHPISGTANFVSYTEDGFGYKKQEELAQTFRNLSEIGATVILSNSFCSDIISLYKGFEIVELMASRNVGGQIESRQPVKEILVISNTVAPIT